MTITQTDLARSGADEPQPVVVEVDGIPLSGLLAEAPNPRAVVVAIHGGATNSTYFDCPGHPELSLLRTAAGAGYTVLALDRPGYGSSGTHLAELADPQRRVNLMFDAIDEHLGAAPRGAGVFLAAHSAGSYLSLQMAADDRGRDLLGLELAGYGTEPQPGVQEMFEAAMADASARKRRDGAPVGVGRLLWHPHRLYPDDMVGGAPIGAFGPRFEADTADIWHEVLFPRFASRIGIPIRFTVGDHEQVWHNDVESLTELASHFTAAPRIVLNMQPNSGHNLSVGRSATAYHLKLLSFVEECAVARETGEFTSPARQFDGWPLPT